MSPEESRGHFIYDLNNTWSSDECARVTGNLSSNFSFLIKGDGKESVCILYRQKKARTAKTKFRNSK